MRTIKKILKHFFKLLAIISLIGVPASLLYAIWVSVMTGIQIFLSCFVLYVTFYMIADKLGSRVVSNVED